ncbi:hypothetical protein L6164_012110 [Bauhinia variegata]|uniref:Uncharacterized protein n=1 Tax=Bauhinia variegata TaxID=167791 RepID=A0ACB9P8F7_BAUVA|nr:hypothetical protein L6164_012110 [Bauhinia variegata]
MFKGEANREGCRFPLAKKDKTEAPINDPTTGKLAAAAPFEGPGAAAGDASVAASATLMEAAATRTTQAKKDKTEAPINDPTTDKLAAAAPFEGPGAAAGDASVAASAALMEAAATRTTQAKKDKKEAPINDPTTGKLAAAPFEGPGAAAGDASGDSVAASAALMDAAATRTMQYGVLLDHTLNTSLYSTKFDAREVWKTLSDRFSQQNAVCLFELRHAIFTNQQGTDSISAYYTKLSALWDELSSYQTNPLYSSGALREILKANERDRLIEFLHGLQESYASIRSQILSQDPLPSVNKAYSMLLQEERQQGLYQPSITADTAAMAAQKSYQKGGQNPGSSTRPYCTRCGKSGHYESKCYKKHDYPPEINLKEIDDLV